MLTVATACQPHPGADRVLRRRQLYSKAGVTQTPRGGVRPFGIAQGAGACLGAEWSRWPCCRASRWCRSWAGGRLPLMRPVRLTRRAEKCPRPSSLALRPCGGLPRRRRSMRSDRHRAANRPSPCWSWLRLLPINSETARSLTDQIKGCAGSWRARHTVGAQSRQPELPSNGYISPNEKEIQAPPLATFGPRHLLGDEPAREPIKPARRGRPP